jgi:hypothetical protein
MLDPLAITGLLLAAIRAEEHLRPDRLFEDPFMKRAEGRARRPERGKWTRPWHAVFWGALSVGIVTGCTSRNSSTSGSPSSAGATMPPASSSAVPAESAVTAGPQTLEAFLKELQGIVDSGLGKCSGNDKKAGEYRVVAGFTVAQKLPTPPLDFRADAAARCIASARKAGVWAIATVLGAELDGCSEVLTGHAPLGATCTHSNECSGDFACVNGKCAGAGEGQQCANVELGEADIVFFSRPHSGCAQGLACATDNDREKSTCERIVPLGGPCDVKRSGPCGPSATCRRTSAGSTEATCVPLGSEGASCVGANDCKASLSCLKRDTSDEGRCVDRQASGSVCALSTQCLGRCEHEDKTLVHCVSFCGQD